MPTFTASQLANITKRIFENSNVPSEVAQRVAASLVESNLKGHDSHGVIRIMDYLDWIEKEWILPDAKLEVVKENDHILMIDGHLGFGQVVGREATTLAINKATVHGFCILTIRRSAHLGRIGEFMEMAADAGLAAFSFTNTHGGGVLVAPHGGVERRLSANPLAAAAPINEDESMIMDISTSTIAEGKIKVAREKGESLPEGCILDNEGQPTTRTEAYYANPPGVLLPFAGHKGYALSLFCEVFAGALSGAGCSKPGEHPIANGFFALLVDPAVFNGKDFCRQEVQNLLDHVKSSKPMSGFSKILYPGEPEAHQRAGRSERGITLDDSTWSKIAVIAKRLNVKIPD